MDQNGPATHGPPAPPAPPAGSFLPPVAPAPSIAPVAPYPPAPHLPPPGTYLPPPTPTPAKRPIIRTPFVVALCVIGVLMAIGVVSVSVHAYAYNDLPPGLQSQSGNDAYHGFRDGCHNNGETSAFCDCLWTQLTSRPQYSTVDGLNVLARQVETFLATRRLSDLPAAYWDSILTCRRQLAPGSPAPPGSPSQRPA